MSSSSELELMSRARIFRSLKRMAYEVAEQNKGNTPINLFGIDNRGFAVANELSGILNPMFGDQVQAYSIPLKTGDPEEVLTNIDLNADHFPLIVDDVIFSGKTMFKALKVLFEHIHFSEIHTLALIDRGHRKFPIKAEFYGMELPTKLNEHVSVIVENQQPQQVILQKQ